ncbi:tetratricopeptide repeat protein [Chitinophaga ginsengisegetis]|uniref:tetratricopeptide repeat-containing sensor histidine kinase n=1 Tax=Chitinophaga ginsengisegetis TaxID=393003 RepID=UPI000DB9027A|nr:tetratricopeptide repeat protein [Chitinophaga ginsengisegetis]MDR6569256.1 tetratricopeptide (TPR) repeat protein [Chitinophaga ginsengisegetis]MDR6648714.1 tetratricopeptide (TPR) repeat protein [Chitinophaga ginsengisegetis]MDR6655338.1 tetratricopeptide (TPR) repeat protein [Chitinophaga ginsengisegetis]
MRPSSIILPILLGSLLACTSNRESPQLISAPTLEKGESFFNKNNDSAFYYFNLVATGATDSLEIAMAYTYMGIIQAYEGDHYGGQESLLKSLTYLDEHKKEDQECLGSNYHELGNICLNLKNYEAAIDYYNKALKYITHPKAEAIALNSIALTYQKKGDYDQAIGLYKSLLVKSKDKKKEYARVLSNYAKTKWLKDSTYPAGPELQQALQIRKDSNDIRGLNASYAHLSDYYSLSLPDSALYYAVKRYEIAREMNSPDDEVEALSKLITLSPTNLLKPYFVRYQYLTDSIQTAKNAAKNQFALIRYEAAKNKADNLQLQKDNAQKKTQLVVQRFLLALTILFFITAGIILILRYRRRRQQIEFASRQAIQEHQLKTSQKVHDVVANGLYRIMTDLEYKASLDKEELIDKIEVLYERSRDISYENPTVSKVPFHVKIDDLLESFGSDHIKVLIFGNGPMLWSRTNAQIQHEVEHILQELMINMKKHSQANSVMIKFECQNGQVQIHYTDDGIGISPQVKHGNGLQNTGNRIKSIGGQYTFEHPVKGLKIHISFPIAQSS